MFSHSDTVRFQARRGAAQTLAEIRQPGEDCSIISRSFPCNFSALSFILILIFWLSCAELEGGKVACCKLGHPHPIAVERTRRALQSRAVRRLRLRHDSKRAMECLRSYLGVKAVVRVLGDKRCEGTATFEFWVCSGCSQNLSKFNLNLHDGAKLFPHVCHTREGCI